jgi:nicotinate-nucleotide adenylyltransferase
VVFVLPRAFPHKRYEGASFEDRIDMLEAALASEPRFSIATTDGGLFIEIARECRSAYGPLAELYFLCGRDAAERIVNWDYGAPGAFEEQLREYQLLVAPRQGTYTSPPQCGARIHSLTLEEEYDELSASDVRARIARGEPWEHLVPEQAVALARGIYRRA